MLLNKFKSNLDTKKWFKFIMARMESTDAPTVQTKNGLLSGTIRKNINGGEYFAFLGVPFAEPPSGKLRFRDPQPLKPWQGVYEATVENNPCAQFLDAFEGSDDCLYLNIATTSLTEKRPVMVWLHGGSFLINSNSYKKYGPDYLLGKDVVVVNVNYRLGLLGFLNMEHEECPGSQGLKDQIAALKWVRDNIESFGGDSSNVTVFGESAGSASAHGICISPQAKGLFHKVILQSGVISSPWASIQSNIDIGFALAKYLGKDCSNSLDAIEFLRTIPVMDLLQSYNTIYKTKLNSMVLNLVPTLDLTSSNPIFPQSIEKMCAAGIDVPLLIGYNTHEGILYFLNEENITKTINDLESVLASILKLSDRNKIAKITKVIREHYFANDDISETKINELVQLLGDIIFVNGIHAVVETQMGKPTPTYLYRYSYRCDFPTTKEKFNCKIEGTCHAEELGCLFVRGEKLEEGTRDRITMERLTTMWTNFAKNGNPTPIVDDLITTKWLPVEKNKKNYLEINDTLTIGENPNGDARQLFKSLL